MNEKEKILWNIAEMSASYLESAAKSKSRNKELPDDCREKYKTMANKFGEMKDTFHKNREKEKNADNKMDDIFEDIGNFSECSKKEHTRKCKKNYIDSEREEVQISTSSSNLDIGMFTLSQWETRWIELGKISTIDLNDEELKSIGIIKLVCDAEVVYIVRAIELGKGGIIKKLQEIKDLSDRKKSTIYRNIREKYDYISVEILKIGNDDVAINICRNLERELIKKYNPKWLQ